MQKEFGWIVNPAHQKIVQQTKLHFLFGIFQIEPRIFCILFFSFLKPGAVTVVAIGGIDKKFQILVVEDDLLFRWIGSAALFFLVIEPQNKLARK